MMDGLKEHAFSSEELILAHIDRIQKLQPIINAVTHERFEEARREARAADQLRMRGDENLPTLLGMPISVKEMYAIQGLPWTGGVHRHRDRIATKDAEAVHRVREAGAVVLCKTNTSTLTMTHETDNVLFGRTSHPLDPTRTPGGSSGGEAALIASYGSAWGIGSDLGGSIRLPAHLCGICGIRPTHDVIPTDGEYPSYPHHLHMNSAGPLARTVQDVRLLYEVLSHRKADTYLDGVKVHWLASVAEAPVDNDMLASLGEIVREVSQAIPVEPADGALLHGVVQLWQSVILSDGGQATIEEIREGESFSLEYELMRALFGRRIYHKWILALLFGAKYVARSKRSLDDLMKEISLLRAQFNAVIGDRGVLLMPVFPWTAPKHGKIANTVYSNRGHRILPYLVLANALGYPAMTVRAGIASNGLPFGIQVVGGEHGENEVFAVAELIEQICS
ncbi:amidase [Alicyclobacillus dauci]|uniref:Amidase n=1 Tax=Alicyclobacillus dauci TaxID=1475485 RepID=A0ABY6Z4L4_9BACL|nr:amidase [Alicyclobacillus dauci]WAH37772.1 amidase [Alicyclobacillus dauci]